MTAFGCSRQPKTLAVLVLRQRTIANKEIENEKPCFYYKVGLQVVRHPSRIFGANRTKTLSKTIQ